MPTTKIFPSYKKLYLLFLGEGATGLEPGRVEVRIKERADFSASGTLNSQRGLSGMARVYNELALNVGDTLEFTRSGEQQVTIEGLIRADGRVVNLAEAVSAPQAGAPSRTSIFEVKGLKHLHIDLFHPGNFTRWEPQTEPDVYLAFGVLQEHTRFRYCCGTSAALLRRLGYLSDTKPDAILIDSVTDEYLVAEFKMNSSAFPTNHAPGDVDVLVVWIDDAKDRAKLPAQVVALEEIARLAVSKSAAGG